MKKYKVSKRFLCWMVTIVMLASVFGIAGVSSAGEEGGKPPVESQIEDTDAGLPAEQAPEEPVEQESGQPEPEPPAEEAPAPPIEEQPEEESVEQPEEEPEEQPAAASLESAAEPLAEDDGLAQPLADVVTANYEWVESTGTLTIKTNSGTTNVTMAWYSDPRIGDSATAVADRTAVKNLVIENGVTALGHSAFKDCTNLVLPIVFPSSLKEIGNYAFQNCNSLTDLPTLPATLTGDTKMVFMGSAFQGCAGLTTITIPDTDTLYGYTLNLQGSTFRESGVTNVTFEGTPSFLTGSNVGSSYFYGCAELTTIDLGGITEIPATMFVDCEKLTAVTGLGSVTSIGSRAFDGCTALTSVDLSSATSIGSNAFRYCSSLTSVDLSAATSVGSTAFGYCTGITSVTMPGGSPHITLSVDPADGSGGSASLQPNSPTEINLQAVPKTSDNPNPVTNPNYQLKNWTGVTNGTIDNAASRLATYTVGSGDDALVAHFEIAPPAIALSVSGLTGLQAGKAVTAGRITYALSNAEYADPINTDDFTITGLPDGLEAGTPERFSATQVRIPVTGTPTTANAAAATLTYNDSIPMANITGAVADVAPTGTVTASAVSKATYPGSITKSIYFHIDDIATTPAAGTLTADFFFDAAAVPAEAKITNVSFNANSHVVANAGVNDGILSYTSKTGVASGMLDMVRVTIQSKDYADFTATINFQTTDARPAITHLAASPAFLTSAGGTSAITVIGTDLALAAGLKVTAFDGDTATAVTGVAEVAGDSASVTLDFPKNTSKTADKSYIIKVSADNGITWYDATCTVTVVKASGADATPAPSATATPTATSTATATATATATPTAAATVTAAPSSTPGTGGGTATKTNSAKTGDDTNIALWIVLIPAAGAAMAIAVARHRKRRAN